MAEMDLSESPVGVNAPHDDVLLRANDFDVTAADTCRDRQPSYDQQQAAALAHCCF